MGGLTQTPVHVVGGGIGGLAVAVALIARGFDVHVHEAAPSYEHVGGGHWLYANALHALSCIDPELSSDMVALGKRFDGFCFMTPSKRRMLFETTTPYTPSPELAPIVVRRHDIIDQLARRVPAGRLHFGRRLKNCFADRLVFEDGTVVEAPIIIGADGIHSVVRSDRLGLGPARFSGQVGLWGISPFELPADTGRLFTEMWDDGIRMGFTYVGTEGVYWFMVVKGEEIPDDPHARKQFILDRGEVFPPQMLEAVRQTEASAIHSNPLFDFAPPSCWFSGNAVCLGDAIHACTPNLGQGGCQAIEDGLALAQQMSAHDDLEVAFRAFQKQRLRKTRAVVFLSRWLGELAQLRGVSRLRFWWLRLTPVWLIRPVLKWIMCPPR